MVLPKGRITASRILNQVVEYLHDNKEFAYKLLVENEDTSLAVTHLHVDVGKYQCGPMSFAHVIIAGDGSIYFHVYGNKIVKQLSSMMGHDTAQEFGDVLQKLKPECTLCGGIPKHIYDEESVNVRTTPKCSERTHPFHAYHATTCEQWFECKNPSRHNKNNNDFFVCGKCSQFLSHVRELNKRNDITAEKKRKRQDPSSRYNITLLSAASGRIRHRYASRKREYNTKKIKRLEKRVHDYKMTLEDEQNKELTSIVNIINDKYSEDINTILVEADKKSPETGKVIHDIWEQDTKDREDFVRDQCKNS